MHLLETIISIGDVHPSDSTHVLEPEIAGQEIAVLLRPLALLASNTPGRETLDQLENLSSLQRDAWFNLVVHGYSLNSSYGKKHRSELSILACASRALIAEDRADRLESDIELNIILRRGMSPQNTVTQKKEMIAILPQCESDIRALNYPELMFLKAAHLVEILRATSGDCSQSLNYFVDPDLKTGSMGNCMIAVSLGAVDSYLAKTLPSSAEAFSAPFVAEQLSAIFEGCCHRIGRVQQAAYLCAERIITSTPSALCQKTSVFTLLDLLTIMWSSCLDEEIDEYAWKSTYTSPSGATSVQLSDNYEFRRYTLQTFHARAKGWILKAINIAPLDIKGLLQVSGFAT
jgi:phosphatidylinositol 4-kinase